MQKTIFISRLRAVAKDLEPLTLAATSGAMAWDGRAYRKVTTDKHPDPYALAWWSTLNTLADMIEYQECELGPEQISYLKRVLFGGMGSLNDLWFDEQRLGKIAEGVNKRLTASREALFGAFEG